MSKFVNLLLVTVLASGSVYSAVPPASPLVDKKDLLGIWAMLPLKNGIANVVEFKANDQVLLYPFNCEEPQIKVAVETSHYAIDAETQVIKLTSPGYESQLKILDITERMMKLEQPMGFEDISLTFLYLKAKKIAPLCNLHKPSDKNKETAFKAGDFIANPVIPPHPDMERYVGRWQDKNITQFEIVKNKQGQFILFQASNENWHHLFNNAHWEGNELHFQSYAYSEKSELFDHPYHKSLILKQISLLPNGKLSVNIDIDGYKEHMEWVRE